MTTASGPTTRETKILAMLKTGETDARAIACAVGCTPNDVLTVVHRLRSRRIYHGPVPTYTPRNGQR